MSTADFLVKFNALDDDAREVIIKMVDLLYPVSRKTGKKNGKKVEEEEGLDFWKFDERTIKSALDASEKIKRGDYSSFLTQEQIEKKHGVSFSDE
ncbi:MAG: hypothetical protein JNJ47_07830 [Alphaproteobacteria bacterium]|nr:hypothetical protein [Alphaproteobacteria bacterium]